MALHYTLNSFPCILSCPPVGHNSCSYILGAKERSFDSISLVQCSKLGWVPTLFKARIELQSNQEIESIELCLDIFFSP